jgi:hypothetical protein
MPVVGFLATLTASNDFECAAANLDLENFGVSMSLKREQRRAEKEFYEF